MVKGPGTWDAFVMAGVKAHGLGFDLENGRSFHQSSWTARRMEIRGNIELGKKRFGTGVNRLASRGAT
jgi:hypothetical protein